MKKGKEPLADRGVIPIPSYDDEDEDAALPDHDLEVLEEYGIAASFLDNLDYHGIARSIHWL